MEKKFELNAELLGDLEGNGVLAGYMQVNHLKQLYRQGWLRVGISREQCESVAEHIFGMTMLAWMVIDAGLAPEVDRDKVLRMALAHELGEIYTGDIIPADKIPAEEKQKRERAGMLRVVEGLAGRAEFVELWEEFEAGTSNEARLVRQLDRLEMALQALAYERQGYASGDMESFYRSAQAAMQDNELDDLLAMVKAARRA